MASLLCDIKEMILEEQFSPGDRLPTEMELAERFGVSRHKLREGLQGLTALGIIESSPRRGMKICSYDAGIWAENLAFHGRVTGYELVEAYEARVAMELSVIPVVVHKATDDDWMRFERLLLEMDLAMAEQRMDLYVQADQDFHELLVEATHNPLLQMLQPMVRWIFLEIQRTLDATEESKQGWLESEEQGWKDHREIVSAMRRGDVVGAQAVMKSHLEIGIRHASSVVQADDSSQ